MPGFSAMAAAVCVSAISGQHMIRASGNSLRIATIASMPCIVGICKSISVMSGWCVRNLSPIVANPHSKLPGMKSHLEVRIVSTASA
jgi:hypothetical protein